MQSILRSVLVVALALTAAGSTSSATASTRRYTSAKYGVSASLPATAEVCASIAPNPNHRVLFRPAGVISPPCDGDIDSGERYTAVDAHFALDDEPATVSSWARASCPAFAYDSQGRVTMITPPSRLGGLARAACRIDGANGSIMVVLFARRAATAGHPAVDYTMTLKTTRSLYATDYPAFVRWLAGVRFFRPL